MSEPPNPPLRFVGAWLPEVMTLLPHKGPPNEAVSWFFTIVSTKEWAAASLAASRTRMCWMAVERRPQTYVLKRKKRKQKWRGAELIEERLTSLRLKGSELAFRILDYAKWNILCVVSDAKGDKSRVVTQTAKNISLCAASNRDEGRAQSSHLKPFPAKDTNLWVAELILFHNSNSSLRLRLFYLLFVYGYVIDLVFSTSNHPTNVCQFHI